MVQGREPFWYLKAYLVKSQKGFEFANSRLRPRVRLVPETSSNKGSVQAAYKFTGPSDTSLRPFPWFSAEEVHVIRFVSQSSNPDLTLTAGTVSFRRVMQFDFDWLINRAVQRTVFRIPSYRWRVWGNRNNGWIKIHSPTVEIYPPRFHLSPRNADVL